MAQAKLEAYGFATRQFTQLCDKLHQFDGGRKCAVARRRNAVFAHRYTAGFGDFLGDLVLGQDATVARFGTLAHLDFDHAHLRGAGLGGKALRVETPVRGAAAEIATAQFPGQVAAMFAVIGTDTAFTRVVGKITEFCTLIQGADRVGTQ